MFLLKTLCIPLKIYKCTYKFELTGTSLKYALGRVLSGLKPIALIWCHFNPSQGAVGMSGFGALVPTSCSAGSPGTVFELCKKQQAQKAEFSNSHV